MSIRGCIFSSLLVFFSFSVAMPSSAQDFCPPLDSRYGNRDYLDPANRGTVQSIERRHFTESVRTLRRGSSGYVIGDIEYMLNWFPNHHGALDALTRLALRENVATPRRATVSVECRFHRAESVNPRDGMVSMIYGLYLFKRGQLAEARKHLSKASELSPNDANVQYNLGLVLFQLKDYPAAKEHAERAYQLGFPLPGLRNMLAGVGHPVQD